MDGGSGQEVNSDAEYELDGRGQHHECSQNSSSRDEYKSDGEVNPLQWQELGSNRDDEYKLDGKCQCCEGSQKAKKRMMTSRTMTGEMAMIPVRKQIALMNMESWMGRGRGKTLQSCSLLQ